MDRLLMLILIEQLFDYRDILINIIKLIRTDKIVPKNIWPMKGTKCTVIIFYVPSPEGDAYKLILVIRRKDSLKNGTSPYIGH